MVTAHFCMDVKKDDKLHVFSGVTQFEDDMDVVSVYKKIIKSVSEKFDVTSDLICVKSFSILGKSPEKSEDIIINERMRAVRILENINLPKGPVPEEIIKELIERPERISLAFQAMMESIKSSAIHDILHKPQRNTKKC